MVFDWLLGVANKRAVKSYIKELQKFVSILKELPPPIIGLVVISATENRLHLQNNDVLPLDIFENKNRTSYDNAQVVVSLRTFETRCIAGNPKDTYGVSVWLHSVRGLVSPEMTPFVKEMWAELSKGFPYVTVGCELPDIDKELVNVSSEIADNFDYIPPQFM